MEFKEFNQRLNNHFNQLASDAKELFVVDVDPDKLWDLYLDSFSPGRVS